MSVTLTDEQRERFVQLEQVIGEVGLYVREDSDLCWDYILYGEEAKFSADPIVIARKMAEAEYLHKYCEFQLGYDIAQNMAQKRSRQGQPPLDQQRWFELINSCVLKTTRTGKFPDEWPWLIGVSPKEWKRENNVSL